LLLKLNENLAGFNLNHVSVLSKLKYFFFRNPLGLVLCQKG